MTRSHHSKRILAGCLLLAASASSAAQAFAPEKYLLSAHRIGAFQCLRCPLGGFLEGVRSSDQARVRRQFSAIQKLCVVRYGYVGREQFVYFRLDEDLWPDKGVWGLKTNSWNAECRLK